MNSPVRNAMFRHVSGSRVNRIDQFEIIDGLVIRLGRTPGSEVLYDAARDDLVSREHATVRLIDPEKLIFEISDDGSSNGTFVNGQKVSGKVELAAEDTVELGKGGPKFIFDIQPRPDGYASRTRVMNVVDAATTRILTKPADTVALTGTNATAEPTPPKSGVGKETIQRMMVEERRSTNRNWGAIVAALVAFVAVGGGALYWNSQRTVEKVRQDARNQMDQQAEEVARLKQEGAAALSREVGTTSRDIVAKFGNSTVQINISWGLYDSATGKPLFLKTKYDTKKQLRPCFVLTREGNVVPWLTLSDDNRSNPKIGSSGQGTGFVVSENGFILTNKHVSAPWMTKYDWSFSDILLFKEPEPGKDTGKAGELVVSSLSSKPGEVNNWVPEQDTGLVFDDRSPVRISSWRTFAGRTDELLVRFPGSRLSMTASLVRASTDADAALIKIDTPQNLTKVQLADTDELVIGDRVTVLGYPAISISDKALVTTTEAGSSRVRSEVIPQPTVNEGLISKIGYEMKADGSTLKTYSDFGETFQLSINTTGSGNSGGPVFSKEGKVIGLYTYTMSYGGVRVSLAVPIKHGRALLQAQKAP